MYRKVVKSSNVLLFPWFCCAAFSITSHECQKLYTYKYIWITEVQIIKSWKQTPHSYFPLECWQSSIKFSVTPAWQDITAALWRSAHSRAHNGVDKLRDQYFSPWPQHMWTKSWKLSHILKTIMCTSISLSWYGFVYDLPLAHLQTKYFSEKYKSSSTWHSGPSLAATLGSLKAVSVFWILFFLLW